MSKQQLPREKKWYVIHTYSGYEDAVAKSLQQRAKSLDMKDKIFDVLVPKEKKTIIKGKEKKAIEEKLYKGYVLVEMIVDDESWYIVRNTPNVIGFVGAGTTPVSVFPKEVEILEKRMAVTEPQLMIKFRVNDLVKINDGPFKGFDAKISNIDPKKEKIKVLVNIFGRDTPLELDVLQVDKV